MNDPLKIHSQRQAQNPAEKNAIPSAQISPEDESARVASEWASPEPMLIRTTEPLPISRSYLYVVGFLALLFAGAVLIFLLSLG